MGDIAAEEVFELDDMEVDAGELGNGDEVRTMMGGIRNFLDKASNAFEAMAATAKTRKRGRSRRSEEEEEEDVKSQPRLVSIKNHLLEDDGHTIIDWKARFLIRPYNGSWLYCQLAFWQTFSHILFLTHLPSSDVQGEKVKL